MSATKVAMAAELFGEAPVIDTPKPKAGGKKARLLIPFEGFDVVAALGVVEKALKAVSKQLTAEIKDSVVGTFIEQMIEGEAKPDSFTAQGATATGLCSLRKRGSNLAVTEETAKKLLASGIHLDTVEKVPARLVINPEILENQEIIGAVAEAIKGHPKLEGVTVIMQQEAETHFAVSEETLPQLSRRSQEFASSDLREILGNVSVVSVGRFEIQGCEDSGAQKRKAIEILEEAGIL